MILPTPSSDADAGPAFQVFECDIPDTPAAQRRPRPVLREKLLPHTLTVSAHQRLIDCPYAFYAADCLQLKTPRRSAKRSTNPITANACTNACRFTAD